MTETGSWIPNRPIAFRGIMTSLQSIVLGLVQGLSEFLPISSSGHLILVPLVTGWTDQGLTFDVAVHIGSLGAVLLYFRKDLFDMLKGVGDWSEPGLFNHPGRQSDRADRGWDHSDHFRWNSHQGFGRNGET